MNSIRSRIIFIGVITLLACYLVAPSIIYFSLPKKVRNDAQAFEGKTPSWLPQKHIKLGLDLQGGVQLVLGVDTNIAVDNKLGRIGTEMTRWANTEGSQKKVTTAFPLKGEQKLRVELTPETDKGAFVVAALKEYPGLIESERADQHIDFAYNSEQLKQIKHAALNQADKVVRTRVDKWGVTEPSISRRVDGSILVQLPGFKDPSKARELLGRTAQLSFKLVNEESKAFEELISKLPEGVTYSRRGNFGAISFVSESKEAIVNLTKGKVPEGSELLFEVEPIANNTKSRFISHLVFAAAELSGEDILDAVATHDTSSLDSRPAVSLKFTGPGGKRFGEITGENIQKRMAIVLDDLIVSDPVIQSRIPSGNAQITMGGAKGFNQQVTEAQDLALILKSGALPAPITILEEREVGATLGPELANQGIFSVLVGLVFVLGYMVLYYRIPGLISCVALILNGLFLVALMAVFGFSLSLPGFAGLILTLGMGVDSNVLINERIRQEMREGKGAKKSVELGFSKVFWTIIDANVTTLIAAGVLLQTSSSGPIRGFSIALILGLLVSMFTSLFCSKVMFEALFATGRPEKTLKLWLGERAAINYKLPTFNYLRWGNLTATIGGILVVVVLITAATKGMNWSVDFAGGTEAELTFGKKVSAGQIADVMKAADLDASLQTVGEGETHYLVRFDKALTQENSVHQIIAKGLKDYEPTVQRVDSVGPVVGQELRTQGLMSVIWSIVGILIYIGLRFDMRFGPGAVLKMILDCLVVFGYYVLFHRSFDLTSVAALLTVIGYCVNDTIVIYDRIRENLGLNPRLSLFDNINLALNETLGRSLNTSIATILSLIGMMVMASSSIWDFAVAMAIGVVSATTTSIFFASWCLIAMEKVRNMRNNDQRKTLARA